MRGLIIAGVFATMMGSTSAALNALATSFTKDFYVPYFSRRTSDRTSIQAARASTVVFGALMVCVATLAAYAVLQDSKLTIIPLALQSFGYAYGSLLAVFLLGMLTRKRGSDAVNILAMLLGIASVLIFCKVKLPAIDFVKLVREGKCVPQEWGFGNWLPAWWPQIAFPWWVLVGCTVCFLVSWLAPTPKERIKIVEDHLSRRKSIDNKPINEIG
jgi:solute:Na+ symporter, SSS family